VIDNHAWPEWQRLIGVTNQTCYRGILSARGARLGYRILHQRTPSFSKLLRFVCLYNETEACLPRDAFPSRFKPR
jgi:hypothetical protein